MVYKSDEAIQSEVMFQLGWDSRIKQSEIGVSVHKRVITLTGVVDSYSKKLAAEQASRLVSGFCDVVNDIEVKASDNTRRDDADIALAIRQALEWNALVNSERIHSSVIHGQVTLTGNVKYFSQRLEAERAVSILKGVRAVTNNIQVEASIEPERVKFLIEDALERRANREASRIRVEVDGGEVTLSGLVNSGDEKKSILGVVSHAPGVTVVRDHLFIDLYRPGYSFAKAW